MGKLSRRKGAAYERLIASKLKKIFGDSCKRGLGQARTGGEVADVDGVPHFWPQLKHGKKPNILAALKQAKRDLEISKKEGLRPIAITRSNREPDIVTMYFTDFLWLIEEWWRNKK